MLQTETHTDDPFVMIRTIRDKIYEQSKHLTPDERIGRTHRESEAFYKRIGNLEDTPRRSGMTLMELMVVVTIMLLVVAISVPTLRPMLESRQARDGAESVRSYLLRARMRAMETGRPCGVRLERFDTSPDACLVLRQVEVPPPYSGMSSNTRIAVTAVGVSHNISFWRWDVPSALWVADTTAEPQYWEKLVKDGDLIQLNNQGPYYKIAKSGSTYEVDFSRETTPPRSPYPSIEIPATSPATYKIIREPRATLTPPLIMPHEMVVDLNYSGTAEQFDAPSPNVYDEFYSPTTTPVTIMFAANGSIREIIGGRNPCKPGNPIYLLVGRWDRCGGNVALLPEDGLWNCQDLSNYWVTINPSNGNVTTAEMAVVTSSLTVPACIVESRAFAAEQR